MKARLLSLLLMLGPGIRGAQAQFRIAPYAAGALGINDTRTLIPIQTNPPTTGTVAEHSQNLLADIHVGITYGHHLAVDAGVRSTLGIGLPFRVLTLGPALWWGQRVQVQVRGGLGRLQGFQPLTCPSSPSACPRYTSEWSTGFDIGAAVYLWPGTRWRLGPAVWWAQSIDATAQYRSIGVGVGARYR